MKRFYFSYDGKSVWKTSSEVTAAASINLKNEDLVQRRFAVAAMHELNHQTGEAALVHSEVPGLLELLEDEDAGVRYWSMATMASLQCNAIFDYMEQIADKLKDTDPGVRTYAAIAIGMVGAECDAAFDYIPNLQECLEDSDPQVRIEAVKAITEMIENEDLVEIGEVLVEQLKDRRFPIFRASAAEAIGYLGEAGLPYVEDLGTALSDKYPRVRQSAASALGMLGVEALEQATIEKAKEAAAKAEKEAADLAAGIKVKPKSKFAKKKPEEEQKAEKKDQCIALCQMTKSDAEKQVRDACAVSLQQMNLGEALAHEDPSYRAWAAERIAAIGPKESAKIIEKLGECLHDEDAKVRYWCAWALGDLGEPAKAFFERMLEDAVNDPDPQARIANTKACVKLDQVGTKNSSLLKDIQPALQHEDWAIRKATADCISAMGADAVPAGPAINEALYDEHAGVRLSCILAINNMGKPAVRVCGKRLGECSNIDPDHDVKKLSAVVLHEFGLAARFGAPGPKDVLLGEED